MAESEPDFSSSRQTHQRDYPPRYQPLVLLVGAVSIGITWDRYLGQPGAHFTAWLGAIGLCLVWLWLRRLGHDRTAGLALLASVVALGAAAHHLHWNLFGAQELGRFARYAPGPVCLEGVALGEPARVPAPAATPFRAIPQGERSRLLVRVVAVRDRTHWRPASGISEVTVDGHLLGIAEGDRMRLFGQLRRIAGPPNPGQFDYAADSRAERRLTRINCGTPAAVSMLSQGRSFSLARQIDAVRAWGERLLWQHTDHRRAPLAAAMLLGRRSSLTKDLTDRYRHTGAIHLLVVSGLHVGIVAGGLYLIKRVGWLPRRWALVAVMATVIAYALVAGGNPPVIRAAVLAVLVGLGSWTGRLVVALNSLAAAALVVLAINPADQFRVGPQLSFLAVATLIHFGWFWQRRWHAQNDPIRRLVDDSRPWPIRWLRSFWRWNLAMLVATAAVWLVAAPLVANQLNIVTPVAVLISPAIWPLVTGTLVSGIGVLVCGALLPPLATWCGAGCDLCLTALDGVIQTAEQLPGGHFSAAGPAGWWVIGFYLGMIWFFVTAGRHVAIRWRVALLAAWVVAGVAPSLAAELRPTEQLRCSFVSLGHGSCVVLQTPAGQTLLYDAGSLSSPEFASRAVTDYLWHQGIGQIDGIILSHADVDHFNAVPGLCDQFDIGSVFVSPVMFDGFDASAGDESAPKVLQRMLQRRGIAIRDIWAGDRLRLGEVQLEVRHPPRQGTLGEDNSDSLTLAVEFAGRRLLLPGDLESPGLDSLLAERPFDVDLLVAPHHGSPNSNPPGLFRWCRPEHVVISGNGGARVDQVEQEYTAAGARVYRTDLDGAIECRIDKRGGISISTWRERTGS